MPTQTIDECRAEIHELGKVMGIPTDNITRALANCATDLEVRALRRKWRDRRRADITRFNRNLIRQQQDAWAAESAIKHGETLLEQARERRSARRRLTLGARLDKAVGELGRLSVKGSSWQTSGATARGSEHAMPSVAQLATVDVSAEMAALAVLIEALEDKLDAEKGLLPPMDYAKMSTADKDQMIARLSGVHAEWIGEHMPWLGSAKTIRRRRKEWDLVPTTGLPRVREPEAA